MRAWTKTANGYSSSTDDGVAVELIKVGRVWLLIIAGKATELGRRASFDDAEALITH